MMSLCSSCSLVELCIVDLCVLCACRLSDLCKRMFNELGSAVVQNVKFRDAWAFVSQKGIQGFTHFEQVRDVANILSALDLLPSSVIAKVLSLCY